MEGTVNNGPGGGPSYHTIEIKRLALHGDGVGRIVSAGDKQGKVAFVPYTLPAETIAAHPAEEKKTFLRCIPKNVLTSSPDRIIPSCPYHFSCEKNGLWCGGCNWQHMTPEKQREAKKDLVRETLERLGRIPASPPVDCLHTEMVWRYRNTAQFVFGSRSTETIAGYYSPASHVVIPIEDCLIQSPLALCILRSVRQLISELDLKPYERRNGRGWLKHLLVRTNESDEALITFITADGRFPRREQLIRHITERCPGITGIFQNVQPSRTSIVTGKTWIHLWGHHRLQESVCGLTFATSPGSFVQVNTGAARLLYRRAVDEARLHRDTTVLDLYCGAGALTLLAASSAAQAIGVDALDTAIEDARKNAQASGIDRVTFHSRTAERFLHQACAQKMLPADRLVTFIDPPRAGCTRSVIDGLMALAPCRIVYLSCNPATLARDLEVLRRQYHLASLTIVDLFPQTSHIETMARLEKKTPRA